MNSEEGKKQESSPPNPSGPVFIGEGGGMKNRSLHILITVSGLNEISLQFQGAVWMEGIKGLQDHGWDQWAMTRQGVVSSRIAPTKRSWGECNGGHRQGCKDNRFPQEARGSAWLGRSSGPAQVGWVRLADSEQETASEGNPGGWAAGAPGAGAREGGHVWPRGKKGREA